MLLAILQVRELSETHGEEPMIGKGYENFEIQTA